VPSYLDDSLRADLVCAQGLVLASWRSLGDGGVVGEKRLQVLRVFGGSTYLVVEGRNSHVIEKGRCRGSECGAYHPGRCYRYVRRHREGDAVPRSSCATRSRDQGSPVPVPAA
jgi:hypothetical protein